MVPRALTPEGIFLVDKPAGPSSFAIVSQVRSRTGARTGHAGTLDPFASGLLLVLSGRATELHHHSSDSTSATSRTST
jgi:tRNA pseudouridine55 synthase